MVAILLLAPAVFTFGIDYFVQRRQTAMLGARAVPYSPRPSRGFDAAMTAFCCVIALLMLAMLGMAIFASFATFWPYNLTPSFKHYIYGLIDNEVAIGFINSLKMAAGTALFGTVLVLCQQHWARAIVGLFLPGPAAAVVATSELYLNTAAWGHVFGAIALGAIGAVHGAGCMIAPLVVDVFGFAIAAVLLSAAYLTGVEMRGVYMTLVLGLGCVALAQVAHVLWGRWVTPPRA